MFDEITIPKDALPLAGPHGPPSGLDPDKQAGLFIDDRKAKKIGKWTEGQGLKPYFGYGYLYSGSADSAVTFDFKAPADGRHEIRIAWQPHENRGKRVPVTVKTGTQETTIRVNMSKAAPLDNGLFTIGFFQLKKDAPVSVHYLCRRRRGVCPCRCRSGRAGRIVKKAGSRLNRTRSRESLRTVSWADFLFESGRLPWLFWNNRIIARLM